MKNFISLIVSFLPMLASAQNVNQSLLWKVEGKGIVTASYIYGTIHLACPDDIIFTATLEHIFSQQHALYLELDMDDPAVFGGMLHEMQMKGDTSLKTLLEEADYEKMAVGFEALTHLPLSLFNRSLPLITMSAVYPALLNCSSTKSWEMELTNLAHQKHIPVYGLESLQEQLDVFESVSYVEQAQMLATALQQTDSMKNEFLQLLQLYKQKDVEALSNMIRSSETMGSMEDALLNIRNKNWIPRIISLIKENPIFFAVGAGHLGGQMGILNLLKKEGYTVTPVAY